MNSAFQIPRAMRDMKNVSRRHERSSALAWIAFAIILVVSYVLAFIAETEEGKTETAVGEVFEVSPPLPFEPAVPGRREDSGALAPNEIVVLCDAERNGFILTAAVNFGEKKISEPKFSDGSIRCHNGFVDQRDVEELLMFLSLKERVPAEVAEAASYSAME